jgi:hypothetical protein
MPKTRSTYPLRIAGGALNEGIDEGEHVDVGQQLPLT